MLTWMSITSRSLASKSALVLIRSVSRSARSSSSFRRRDSASVPCWRSNFFSSSNFSLSCCSCCSNDSRILVSSSTATALKRLSSASLVYLFDCKNQSKFSSVNVYLLGSLLPLTSKISFSRCNCWTTISFCSNRACFSALALVTFSSSSRLLRKHSAFKNKKKHQLASQLSSQGKFPFFQKIGFLENWVRLLLPNSNLSV